MTTAGCTRIEWNVSDAGDSARARVVVRLLAVVWLFVWVVSLSRSLFDPIGFDQAAWQYATERVMAGDRMYVDVWDQNAPGVIGVHWISTMVAGRTPLALRAFDAVWQLATMALLVLLAARDGRRWSIGWLAATLYALAYYGTGYVHTAQRDGFAVLPMLLMLHAAVAAAGRDPKGRSLGFGLAAGVMGFIVFAIKPPLGLCYGAVWVYLLGEAWRRRRVDGAAAAGWVGLTVGFLAAAAAGVAWMVHLGWWPAFVQTMTRSDVRGYTKGPWMVRQMVPTVLLVMAAMALAAAVMGRRNGSGKTKLDVGRLPDGLRAWAVAVFVCVVMLTVAEWTDWQPVAIGLAGLWVPAVGSVLLCAWAGRSPSWRLTMLAGAASAAAIVFQGRFFLYHFHPLIACASYLAAVEIAETWTRTSGERARGENRLRVWQAVCLGMFAYLAIGFWGGRMTFYGSSPYVLSDTTLTGHYDRVTQHKSHYPLYSTSVKVADRVRALTRPDQPIACLLNEPRIYYLSQRPAAHGLIIPNEAFRPKFDEFIRTIHEKQPLVVLARLPKDLLASAEAAAITDRVLAEAEAFFGPATRTLRGDYRVTEVIDDVCILRPVERESPH